MLALKPNCECCDKDLPPSATDVRICTFECTFCAACAETHFNNTCPNCGGNFVPRPIRPAHHLDSFPASTKRFSKDHTPCRPAKDAAKIINWRRLDGRITLSGQPSEDQLHAIKALGVTHIINLGPHHNDGALDDEAASVAALGLEYIYIPVGFEAPTDADFEAFCAALERFPDARIHVHCIYNARVTAFFYRYAKTGRGLPVQDAFALMDGIWKPGNNWADFIGDDTAKGQPNRYAGDEY